MLAAPVKAMNQNEKEEKDMSTFSLSIHSLVGQSINLGSVFHSPQLYFIFDAQCVVSAIILDYGVFVG